MQHSISESAQYGVNKVEIRKSVPAGEVQRITTAIVIDDAQVKSVQNGKVTYQRIKRSPEELDKIQQLAEAAVGFDAKRGDAISVQNLSFDSAVDGTDIPPVTWTNRLQKTVSDYAAVFRPASLLVLFTLAYLFVLLPIQKRALAAGSALAPEQAALAEGPRTELLAKQPEPGNHARRAAELKEHTIQLIKQKPATTARAVQVWLREDPS
jgi:flagellar M-ring protein FliF